MTELRPGEATTEIPRSDEILRPQLGMAGWGCQHRDGGWLSDAESTPEAAVAAAELAIARGFAEGPCDWSRARRSLAEQLREALDDLVAHGKIESWTADYGAAGVTSVPARVYTVEHFRSVFGRFVYQFTPGECMDFVNEYGYDVQLGGKKVVR